MMPAEDVEWLADRVGDHGTEFMLYAEGAAELLREVVRGRYTREQLMRLFAEQKLVLRPLILPYLEG